MSLDHSRDADADADADANANANANANAAKLQLYRHGDNHHDHRGHHFSDRCGEYSCDDQRQASYKDRIQCLLLLRRANKCDNSGERYNHRRSGILLL